jgi:hypothetical protein
LVPRAQRTVRSWEQGFFAVMIGWLIAAARHVRTVARAAE